MTDGGEGSVNFSHKEETKKKISETSKLKVFSEIHRKNLSIANSGKNHPNYGKHLKEETRKKLSISNSNSKHPSARKVIDIKSKIIFGCIKEAAISLNMKPSTLREMLRGKNKNKTNIRYLNIN